MTKKAIKEILSVGGTVSLNYKSKISHWYSTTKIFKIEKEYIVDPGWNRFYDIEEAINFFCNEALTSKNVGYIQSRLQDKGIDFENEYNLENPSGKLKKLFEEEGIIVDEEAKKLDIKVINFPKTKDAVKELKSIIKEINVNNVKEKISFFEKKYITLNPYINMSFVFNNIIVSNHDYRQGLDYNEFTIARLENAKKEKGDGSLSFNKLELTVKLNESKKYYRFDLKF